MPGNSYLFGAVVVLFAVPALADIINVSHSFNNGSSASVGGRCLSLPNCFQGGESIQFSLPGTGSVDNGRVSLTGSIVDTTTVTPQSVHADVETVITVNAAGAEWGATANLSGTYSLSFTVTTESLLHLMVDSAWGPPLSELQGPGVFLISGQNGLDRSFDLMPGTYFFHSFYSGFLQFSPQGPFTHDTQSGGLVTKADFTPIVPEPSWNFAVPALLFVIARCAHRLRRASSPI